MSMKGNATLYLPLMPISTARERSAAICVRLAWKAAGLGVWIVTLTMAPPPFLPRFIGQRLGPVQHALAALQDGWHFVR